MFEIMFDDLKPEAQEKFLKYMGLKDASEGNYEVVPIATIDYGPDDTGGADNFICLEDEDYLEDDDGCLLVDPDLLDPRDKTVDVSVDYYHSHYKRYRVRADKGPNGETILDPTGYEYTDDDEDEDEADMDNTADHELTFDCPDDVQERDDGGIDLAFADVLLNGDHPEDYHVGETVDVIFETNPDFTRRFRIEEKQPDTGTIVLGGPIGTYDVSKEDLKMPWERY